MPDPLRPRAGGRTFAGLFLVTLSTLTYQLLLTRIFSVTMYYHFAFVAISVTMFGMSVGALLVYLRSDLFTADRLPRHLTAGALGFALTIVASFLAHVWLPFRPELSIAGLASVIVTYAVLSIPFTFSGVVVSLALTRFPSQVSGLYAADLAGAALGCALLGPLLRVTDAPTAIVAMAAVAAVGALLFARDPVILPPDQPPLELRRSAGALAKTEGGSHLAPEGSRGFRAQAEGRRSLARACIGVALILATFAVAHTVAVHRDAAWLRLVWVKGKYEAPPIVERWNPFSRIRVIGDPSKLIKPSGWGLSATLPPSLRTRELHLDIDSYAGTDLTAYNGDPAAIDHLKYDVTNVVHALRPSSDVVVVGTGGGRDVLAALAFNQRRVTGIEINPSILELVNGRFGDFTGHLDRDPRVRFVNDEARSHIARMREQADIIQISLIDTWAATASGAFVLTENSLYTLEAWTSFMNHLSPRGILSVSRWYYADRPGEVYRSAALAATTLMRMGVKRPGDHFAIVRARPVDTTGAPDGIGTILVARQPLSESDLDTLDRVASRLQFDVVQSPRTSIDETFAAIASGDQLPQLLERYPLDISAPTDDSPFFFHMLRLRDVFNVSRWRDQGIVAFNMKAVGVLGVLLATVVAMTGACIVLPLALSRGRTDIAGAAPHLIYFAAIGFGFMLIEISQLQRLTIFLGHPAYSLSVVLFSLLLSSGAGSLSTGRSMATARARLAITVAILVAFGLVTPMVIRQFEAATTPTRILLSVVILFPPGFCMGMAFPLGMRAALERSPRLAPWLWGINGATSVCASVLAVVIAIGAGISAAFWVGVICYVCAFGAYTSSTPNPQLPIPKQSRSRESGESRTA
jgi:hypothetical protein